MKNPLISAVSMLILMQNTVTIAQEPEKNAYIIEKFDNNHDGMVTQDEFLESAAKRFKTMDIDSDGAIEKEEFLQRYAEHSHKTTNESPVSVEHHVFDKMDEDHDGKITEDEYNESGMN